MGRSIGRESAAQRAALLLLCLYLLFLLCGHALPLFEPVLQGTVEGAPMRTDALWPNLLPALLLGAMLFAASGRLLFSLWCGYWLLWLLFGANAIKLDHLDRSLMPGDFALLPDLLRNHDMFLPYLALDMRAVAAAASVVAISVVLGVCEPRSLRFGWPVRLLLLVLFALAFVTLLRGHAFWRSQVGDYFKQHFAVWAPERSTRQVGLLAALTRLSWDSMLEMPQPDRPGVARLLSDNSKAMKMRAARAMPPELPDIVIVQGEAFFDPSILVDVDAEFALPHFRRLSALGLSGKLAVPTYGGGTIRTEFEMLTGYPLEAFPSVEYPYYRLALRTPTSLPRTLAAFGYDSVAMHPYRATFWNRNAALRQLGFDRMQFEEGFEQAARRGPFVSDEALYEQVLAALPDSGPPRLVLAITIENHGPWNKDRGLDPQQIAELPRLAGFGADADRELQNYLLHLRAGDAALGQLADRLMARSRPTLLLYYGDHLPSLEHVYAERAFKDGRPPWLQPADYLMLCNRGRAHGRVDTDAKFLAGLVLEALDAPITGYLSLNSAVRDMLAFRQLEPTDRDYLRAALANAARADYAGVALSAE